MTSDKGLAGSFNGTVIRTFEKFMKNEHVDCDDGHHAFISIGQKAKQYMERRAMPLVQSFVRAGDFTSRAESDPIAEFLIGGYLKGDWDEIIVFSTTFVTALRQDVEIQRQLLPISSENIRETAEEVIPRAGRYSHYLDIDAFSLEGGVDFLIEPSAHEVLEKLAPELLKVRFTTGLWSRTRLNTPPDASR